MGRVTDHQGIGRRQSLDSGGNVGRFSESQLFLTPCATHGSPHDQSRMNANAGREWETFGLLQMGRKLSQGSENTESRPDGSVWIVFMCLRIAEVYEEPIPEEVGEMPIGAVDKLSAHLFLVPHHVPVLFGVELGGESRGVHQIAKHD